MFSALFSKKQDPRCDMFVEWALTKARETFPTYFNEATIHVRQRQLKFEAVATYLAMVLEFLKVEPKLSQDVHDMMFDRFEIALREQGIADVRIGAEIKKLASAFHGRWPHYAKAFHENSQELLVEAWQRNQVVEGDVVAKDAAKQVLDAWNTHKNLPFDEWVVN